MPAVADDIVKQIQGRWSLSRFVFTKMVRDILATGGLVTKKELEKLIKTNLL
jgi:hypothetical protein